MPPVRTLVFAVFVLAAAASGFAQETAAYVSRLQAQPGPQSVLLTWKDPEGFAGARYEVWRSDKEIVRDSLSQAKLLGTVNAGVEAFEDKTVTTPSYYLVLLKDSDGVRKGYYIPFRNKTTTAVRPDAAASGAPARVKLTGLTYASPQVVLGFQAVPADRRLAVYRRAAAFTSAADLKDATLLGTTTGAASPFRDTPPAGLEFYYAVVDAQAYADGKAEAFSPEAATDRPAGFPLVKAQAGGLDQTLRPELSPGTRALPLPLLEISTEPDSGAALAPSGYSPVVPAALPPGAAAALDRWSRTTAAPSVALPPLTVLPEERTEAQDGAAKTLVQILRAYFDSKDWTGAETALRGLLKLTLTDRTEARTRYYLGQALLSQKQYRPAFLEFLAARDLYPAQTRPYLETLFSLLAANPS